ncbi:hypothetical protein GCM10023172_07710 [Hymenobacter ginsengisoli]|uniref:Uncharacterized protein n=1 Tax=Hymenobacter ginsengisoli TaxID=1051626 RepID=A0ABP8Q1B4_9BACT
MDPVAALGQGFAQLGGYYAGAAESGITDNADVHEKERVGEGLTGISGGGLGGNPGGPARDFSASAPL